MAESQIDLMRMLELAQRLPMAFWSHFDKIDTEQSQPPKWNFLINKAGVQCSIFWEESTNKETEEPTLGIEEEGACQQLASNVGDNVNLSAALLEVLLAKIDDENCSDTASQKLEFLVGLTANLDAEEKSAQKRSDSPSANSKRAGSKRRKPPLNKPVDSSLKPETETKRKIMCYLPSNISENMLKNGSFPVKLQSSSSSIKPSSDCSKSNDPVSNIALKMNKDETN
ncbi:Oidioi.mRNA.OKI2018_I69.chr2.g7820.t1.cds [Oikopleura dioica]|uniref:Oidioi.mRNA.OKI2018_I69.chr2.g7820.t1.cds n=1 Tax=Oikopleura dioica TaxID=34765 RepID=A0ABN7T9R2_OIKDI|nr:Oidioi.mRNA.OKI2018_I69.chr2.g7820.t1.cds [Oikopleura dioica]